MYKKRINVIYKLCENLVKIGAFLDKIRKSLSDVGDIVDGAQDVVKFVRRWFKKNELKDVKFFQSWIFFTHILSLEFWF